MWRSRTFWWLFGTYGVLLLGAVGLLGAVVVHRVERQFLRQTEETLLTRAVLVRRIVEAADGSRKAQLQDRVTALGREIQTRITLLGRDGGVLADSDRDPRTMENHADRPEVVESRSSPYGVAQRFSNTLQKPMMYVAVRDDDPRAAVACVRVALPLTEVHERLAGLNRLVWSAAGITALLAMALAFWLAGRTARPLQELTEGAERISRGAFGYKVYPAGNDDVGKLARTFNRMSEALAEQFAQLEEDRGQLRAVLGGMVEGVVALDAEQRILFSNGRAARLLGFDLKTAVGRKLWEIVRRRPVHEIARRALAGPEPCSEELSWNGPEIKSIAVHAAPLPGAPARGAVLVFHDITELRRLEQVRRDFVANVSHELKTPLSVIKACVETLLDGAADDPQHRTAFLQQIAEQSERLHYLILDLLSLARIEAGAEAFEFQAVPVGAAVHACLERHRARAEANQQVLEAVSPDGAAAANRELNNPAARPPDANGSARCPELSSAAAAAGQPPAAAVWADEEALAQILDNLVDNGLKYTPPGGRITVSWQGGDGQVLIEVKDTGIGIPERDLPRIFERFYRVDKARSRELGGTGLGLSIVKHLAQALRGSVSAASTPGQGTTFTVRLPRA